MEIEKPPTLNKDIDFTFIPLSVSLVIQNDVHSRTSRPLKHVEDVWRRKTAPTGSGYFKVIVVIERQFC